MMKISGGIFLYKKIEFLFLVILLITLITISRKMENYVSSSAVDAKKIEVVLDPGHGGCR